MPERVTATPAALTLLAALVAEHGAVLFHQSGGCCDGSSPMCFPQGDFIVGDSDVRLGEIGGAPVYIGAAQFHLWRHTQLIIDVVPGRGGMFSLDNGREQRFLTRSRVFTEDELKTLSADPQAERQAPPGSAIPKQAGRPRARLTRPGRNRPWTNVGASELEPRAASRPITRLAPASSGLGLKRPWIGGGSCAYQ
jgi:uncharacterized protein (DUF779 family)